MRRWRFAICAWATLLGAGVLPVAAQTAAPALPATSAALQPLSVDYAGAPRPRFQAEAPSPWRPLRIAKWSVTAASAGVALYGFLQNRDADGVYEDLERMCQANRERCAERLPGGAYADAQLEAQYQRVRDLDHRARVALIAGQVGVATSVVLFLIDLRNQQPPPNIPYEPPNRLELGPSRDGGFMLRVQLPSR